MHRFQESLKGRGAATQHPSTMRAVLYHHHSFLNESDELINVYCVSQGVPAVITPSYQLTSTYGDTLGPFFVLTH